MHCKIHPRRILDLAVALALAGPWEVRSDLASAYARANAGAAPGIDLAPCLRWAFRETHGIPVFQEQVMLAARDVAGFDLFEANELRRALGKKEPRALREFRERFVRGAAAGRGVPEGEASRAFDELAYYCAYTFQKAHAIPEALLAWRTAFLKERHPREFRRAWEEIRA